MPFSSTYYPDGAEIRYRGHTTGPEILEAKRLFFAHDSPGPAHFVLCDFSDVDQFDVSPADVERIIEQDRAAVRTHPDLAEVVVAQTPVAYGLARMWELRIEDERPRTAVLRTRDDAIDWLERAGVPVRKSLAESGA